MTREENMDVTTTNNMSDVAMLNQLTIESLIKEWKMQSRKEATCDKITQVFRRR